MRRYIIRPHADDYEIYNDLECVARTVHEKEVSPRPTGLLDQHGNELYCVEEMEPIGFIKPRE